MRLILACLAALLLLIQYPLWLGKGGWLHVWDMEKQVAGAQKKIDDLKARNAKLASEVVDLKEGTGAVEERARYELGMIKENEVFVQVLDPKAVTAGAAKAAEVKPVELKPVNAKPVNAKPVNAKPVNAKPVNAKPVNAKPVNAKPPQAKRAAEKP